MCAILGRSVSGFSSLVWDESVQAEDAGVQKKANLCLFSFFLHVLNVLVFLFQLTISLMLTPHHFLFASQQYCVSNRFSFPVAFPFLSCSLSHSCPWLNHSLSLSLSLSRSFPLALALFLCPSPRFRSLFLAHFLPERGLYWVCGPGGNGLLVSTQLYAMSREISHGELSKRPSLAAHSNNAERIDFQKNTYNWTKAVQAGQ